MQEDAVLNHPAAPEDFKLKVPKFRVKPGEVVAIVGRVGCGEPRRRHAAAP
jgi:ABC-type bacteriocin/lantibiotic exporter with double-glycine peptidase domain